MGKRFGWEVKVAVFALGLMGAFGHAAQGLPGKAEVKAQHKPVQATVKTGAALGMLLSKAGVESLDQVQAPKAAATSAPVIAVNHGGGDMNYECLGIPYGWGFSISLDASRSKACDDCAHFSATGTQCRYDCYMVADGNRYPMGGGPCN